MAAVGKTVSSISIHALLAESDTMGVTVLGVQHHFYPRSPCGERPCVGMYLQFACRFLSTLSLRRATARRALGFVDPDISIHALLAESDLASRLADMSTA